MKLRGKEMFIRFHLANDDSGVVGKSYDLGWRPSDTNQPGKLVKSCYLINLSLLPSKLPGKGSNWISEWDAAGNPNILFWQLHFWENSCRAEEENLSQKQRSQQARPPGTQSTNADHVRGAFFWFQRPSLQGWGVQDKVLATHSAGLTCAISLPPAKKKKKKSLGTYTPCSQSSPPNPTRPNNKDRCLRGDHLPVQDFRRRHDL